MISSRDRMDVWRSGEIAPLVKCLPARSSTLGLMSSFGIVSTCLSRFLAQDEDGSRNLHAFEVRLGLSRHSASWTFWLLYCETAIVWLHGPHCISQLNASPLQDTHSFCESHSSRETWLIQRTSGSNEAVYLSQGERLETLPHVWQHLQLGTWPVVYRSLHILRKQRGTVAMVGNGSWSFFP